jgi:transposase-like protein
MIKYSLKKFDKEFSTDSECLDWLFNYRFPNGVTCGKCAKVTKHYKVTNRPCYECEICGNQVYPMVGTIFEKSTTPLRTWFHAMWLMANTRCGISAKQLERETGVTYKTAWRMFKQIRTLLDENRGIFSGEIEADETYIGGRHQGKRGRGASGKTIVAGEVERKGDVSARVVPNVKANTLLPMIVEKTELNSILYTDEMPSYNKLEKLGFNHQVIPHNEKVYVMGDIHTNTIDGFWALVKGGLKGVYHHVSPDYLQTYVNEYSFRYNHRKDENPMFKTFLNRI